MTAEPRAARKACVLVVPRAGTSDNYLVVSSAALKAEPRAAQKAGVLVVWRAGKKAFCLAASSAAYWAEHWVGQWDGQRAAQKADLRADEMVVLTVGLTEAPPADLTAARLAATTDC